MRVRWCVCVCGDLRHYGVVSRTYVEADFVGSKLLDGGHAGLVLFPLSSFVLEPGLLEGDEPDRGLLLAFELDHHRLDVVHDQRVAVAEVLGQQRAPLGHLLRPQRRRRKHAHGARRDELRRRDHRWRH